MTLLKEDEKYVWHPFTQLKKGTESIAIKSGKGVVLTTEKGDTIIDYISSWWVNIHGHCNPYIAESIYKQSQKLEQVIFAGFTHEPAVQISRKLAEILPFPLTRTFFSDNGSTAVEVAIKMAYQYHQNTGCKRTRILAFDGAYHGDTVGAMSVGKSGNFFKVWEDLLFDILILPYPSTHVGDALVDEKEEKCLAELDALLAKYGEDICAIILEPLIQGAGGMRMARPEFFIAVCEKVKSAGGLVLFDEVMTGFGRTGTMFACEQICCPDIICLSKGLTAGFLPMSVTVCREEIYEAFVGEGFHRAFTHGHSFTANSLGCAAALASLEVFEKDNTMQDIKRIEKTHTTIGLEKLSTSKHLKNIRMQGTIIAADAIVADEGYEAEISMALKTYFWENGALIRPLGNTIYLLPPYVMNTDTIVKGYDIILQALRVLMK